MRNRTKRLLVRVVVPFLCVCTIGMLTALASFFNFLHSGQHHVDRQRIDRPIPLHPVVVLAEPSPISPEGFPKLIAPVHGIITDIRHWRKHHPVFGDGRFHQGVDIGAPKGTPIVAAARGLVIYAGNKKNGYGNQVILLHGNIFTRYAHCSKILVKKRQLVEQGQTIALVGSTGASTGPHLHFEVEVGGVMEDPLQFVSIRR